MAKAKAKQTRGGTYKSKFPAAETPPQDAVIETTGSDGPAVKPKKRGREQQVDVHGAELVDIWERRILNPNGRMAPTIHVKTVGMHLRWINCAQPGRYHRARYEQGWIPVTRTELIDEREIYGVAYTPEGFVCRGEKCQEMLMKMPEAIFKQILKRRSEENIKSNRQLKSSLKSAGAKHFNDKYGRGGDQAADALDTFKGSIDFGTEKVSSDTLHD